MIYLDHAATTPPDPRVIEAVIRCMQDSWANPSSVYDAASPARRELRLCRQAIADMLRCDPNEVYFTSGGSEGNAWAMRASQGGPIVTSAIEHASVLLASPGAVRIQPDEQGVIQPEAVERALQKKPALLSIQWANNETGAIQPIQEISRLARKHRVLFHVDAVQAFGHLPVDASLCDLMTLSAHKLYGPRGAGCLYVRAGVKLPPLIPGTQEMNLRGGTENVPAVCGFRIAAELAQADLAEHAERERALLQHFEEHLRIPCMRKLSAQAERLPGLAAYFLPALPAEHAIARLDLRGIAVSGGAACHARSSQPSHVYQAMGLSPEDSRCVIRISVGHSSTMEQMEQAAEALTEIWNASGGQGGAASLHPPLKGQTP